MLRHFLRLAAAFVVFNVLFAMNYFISRAIGADSHSSLVVLVIVSSSLILTAVLPWND